MEMLVIVKLVVDDPETTEPEPVVPSVRRVLPAPAALNQRLLDTGTPGFAFTVNVAEPPVNVVLVAGETPKITGFGVTVSVATLLVTEPLALVRTAKML